LFCSNPAVNFLSSSGAHRRPEARQLLAVRLADIAQSSLNRRYRQISQVLASHGLGFFISRFGLTRFVPLRWLFSRAYDESTSRPEHVRQSLEELGATFIKLGQILSTRADLLPAEYQVELSKLQDAAPPIRGQDIEAIMSAELGRPVNQVFGSFDLAPIAAASIGQVHAATLLDGTAVAVKVQRPGVAEQIEQDLQILNRLAGTLTRRWSVAAEYDVVGIVNEFAETLRGETDYVREGRNAERFAENFRADPTVHFPRVYWDTTSRRVLTLERISGIKIDDLPALDAAGFDRPEIARRISALIMKMIFRDAFYHADPHPGNFFVQPDGRLGVVDFGMVGTVDQRMQDQLVWSLAAVTGDDPERWVDVLFDLGVAGPNVNRTTLRRDIQNLRARYYGRPVGQIAVRPAINDGLAVVRRHHLQLPPGHALLAKTVGMHEALVQRLDPSFDFTAVLLPYARTMIVQHFSPAFWLRTGRQATLDLARLGAELPQALHRLLGIVQRGDLELALRPTGIEPLLRRIERMANRLVLGLMTSAFVLAMAVLIFAFHQRGDPLLAAVLVAGFLGATVLGGYLLWSILRSGRP
jgi:ubiquinone biosynthesis protein